LQVIKGDAVKVAPLHYDLQISEVTTPVVLTV
jgi:hypothetical protein